MNGKVHMLFFLLILMIAPALPMAAESTTTTQSNSMPDDIPEELMDDTGARNRFPEESVELDMLFFTETASSENGLYYVCRRGTDTVAYFGESAVMYLSGGTVFTLEFPGSNPIIPHGESPTESITNYLHGNNPSKWKTGIADCSVLRYPEIYPGIDLVYKTQDGNLKYEFVVRPFANPRLIQLEYVNADSVEVSQGDLIITRYGCQIVDSELQVFQGTDSMIDVVCEYSVTDTQSIGFHLDSYDSSKELVIDPVILAYSTFLGGSDGDEGRGIAMEDGYVYVTGSTDSSDFPTVHAYNSTLASDPECFVTKFAVDGQTLIYSTYLGGSSVEIGYGIAVEDGCVYVTGYTDSADFPTINAYNSTYSGCQDYFVTRFAADGQSLVYSTFLGGSNREFGCGIAVEDGYACVTGWTYSANFPIVSAIDDDLNGTIDCFVTKFAVDGQSLIYSTYLGGLSDDHGRGIAMEDGCVYVTGYTDSADFPTINAYDSIWNSSWDCFVTKFAIDGQSLVYSTFLGGSNHDYGYGIAVEDGCAYVTGKTYSSDFPIVSAYDSTFAGYDSFATKFAADGQSLIYSTYLGGSDDDEGWGIAVEDGCAYMTGRTRSSDFPVVSAYDSTLDSGWDCFVTKFAIDGQSLVYSTFLGGSENDYGYGIAVKDGCAHMTGYTNSVDFPMVNAYDASLNGHSDCFVSMLLEDSDGDGLSDSQEISYGTNPYRVDTDNDNFLDWYEFVYGSNGTDPTDYPAMPQAWYDGICENLDGNATLIQQIKDWLEGNYTAIQTLFFYVEGNATLLLDTVGAVDNNADELTLIVALATANYDWLEKLEDMTIGNLTLIREVLDMLGATVGDADYDGLDDLDELELGTDLQCIDSDCDNLNDAFEVKLGTDPLDDDSDGDSYLDGIEVIAGTDPLDALDYPGVTEAPDNVLFLGVVLGGAAGVTIAVVLVFFVKHRRLT